MEYGELVAYYKQKMLDRFEQIRQQPERQKALELLSGADVETVRMVLELLEKNQRPF